MINKAVPLAPRHSATTFRWRAVLFFTAFVHTSVASYFYAKAVVVDHWNVLNIASVFLFYLLFGLIAFSFWMAFLGFAARCSRWIVGMFTRPKTDLGSFQRMKPKSKTAILIPVYNEDPVDVFAGILAMRRSLIDQMVHEEFAFFVLSDTNRPSIAKTEEQLWAQVVEGDNSKFPIYYRRRQKNIGRKAGNLEDFCERWGSQYEFMIVLDADSLMDGLTLQEMVHRMQASPELGILQVPPVPINRNTFFARLQQFAAYLYGPVFTEGLAKWTGKDGNYWGHNAIIRTRLFMENCGLPMLPGPAPLGGEILSHDFVEAGLMRRSGYGVQLASDLGGSYEECPTNLVDFIIRDQRWCQGNIQHARLVVSEGFHWVSRMHMAMGVLSYASSPLWLAFIMVSFSQAFLVGGNVQSPLQQQLQNSIFVMTMVMLFLPKLWGWMDHALDRKHRRVIGLIPSLFSAIIESIVSCLLAPTMMIFHSRFILNTLRGHKIVWNCQNRDEQGLTWSDTWQQFSWISLLGLLSTVGILLLGKSSHYWFLPITVGWLLSWPLAVLTSSITLGQQLKSGRWLATPEEFDPPAVLKHKRLVQRSLQNESKLANAV